MESQGYTASQLGAASGDTMRDTARVLSELKRIHEAVTAANESVGIALGALWGPIPTAPSEKDGPRPVPSGFFGIAFDTLARIRADADRLAQNAKNMRNL